MLNSPLCLLTLKPGLGGSDRHYLLTFKFEISLILGTNGVLIHH
jgi:hypothetical protein